MFCFVGLANDRTINEYVLNRTAWRSSFGVTPLANERKTEAVTKSCERGQHKIFNSSYLATQHTIRPPNHPHGAPERARLAWHACARHLRSSAASRLEDLYAVGSRHRVRGSFGGVHAPRRLSVLGIGRHRLPFREGEILVENVFWVFIWAKIVVLGRASRCFGEWGMGKWEAPGRRFKRAEAMITISKTRYYV